MSDFSTDEKTNVLFKNFIGVPNTKKDREWYQESYKADDNAALSSGHALNYNNSVDLENVWAADISTNFSASNESVTLNMYVPGTYTVGPVSRDELGSVLKVEKLKLQRVESGNNQSWYCLGNNSVNVLKNIIPFNYKESGSSRPYAYILYNGPTNEMAYGATGGNWMIDHKSGLVYIPDDISGGIHGDGLHLTFYKYIGEPLSNVIITDDNNVKIGVLKNKYEIFKNEKRMIRETFVNDSLLYFGGRLRVHGEHVVIKAGSTDNLDGLGLYNVHSGEEIRYYDVYNRDFAINDKYLAYTDWSGTNKVVLTSLDTGEEVRTFTGGSIGTAIEMTNDYLLIASSTINKIDIYDLNNSFNLISTKEGEKSGTYASLGGFSLVTDGDYIASVSDRTQIINNNYGGVYVHTFSGDKDPVTTLVPTTTFQPYDTQQAYFGYNGIAIGSGYIAVGASYYDISGSSNTNQGAVFIYKINGDKWNSLSGSFTPPDTVIEGDDILSLHFGRSVAISDGYLMVGSYKEDKGVKIYNLETLELVQEVTNNDNMDKYGSCVSAHNGVLVISDNHGDIGGTNYGSVFVYTSTTKSNVQLLTNQLPRLHVDLGGNVGIGTTEPSYKLDVNGDARIRGNILGNTTFMGGNVGIGTTSPKCLFNTSSIISNTDTTIPSSDNFNNTTSAFFGMGNVNSENFFGLCIGTLWNGQSYLQQLQPDKPILLNPRDGNVGIGTNTPNCALEVHGGAGSNDEVLILSNKKDDAASEYHSIFTIGGNNYDVYNNSTIKDGKSTSDGATFKINYYSGGDVILCGREGNGDVGIGTTNPGAKLHIKGGNDTTLKIETGNNTTRKTANILFRTDDTGTAQSHYDAAKIVSGFDDTPYNASYISFQTHHWEDPSWNTSMKIKGGSVGIGETGSTDYSTHKPKLTARASTTGAVIVWRNMSDTRVGELYANVAGNGEIYLNDSTGAQKVKLSTSASSNITGSLTVGGSNVSSDDRLKHNEKPITNALDIINKLEAKQYFKTTEMYDASHDFELDASGNPLDASGNPLEKGKDYRIENGLIAQDLLKIPELSFVVSGGDKEVEVPIYEKDASGIVLDESGNIAINKSTFTLTSNDEIAIYTDIYEEDPSGNRVYKDSVYKKDASGNYELDASGEKIVDLINEGGYKLDKEGNVMDETGNKLMDKDGNVLDASGNKNQVDVKKEIKSEPYGVDYMSICVLQMRAIQELQVRLAELEGQ